MTCATIPRGTDGSGAADHYAGQGVEAVCLPLLLSARPWLGIGLKRERRKIKPDGRWDVYGRAGRAMHCYRGAARSSESAWLLSPPPSPPFLSFFSFELDADQPTDSAICIAARPLTRESLCGEDRVT